MMMKPISHIFLKLAAIALVQTFVLGWIVWDRVSLLRNGQEVRLAVVPIDPRDLLRGDYVILRFNISRIDTLEVGAGRDFKRGNQIFVGLKKSDDGQWNAVSANLQRPGVTSDVVFIKGNINRTSTGKNGALVLNVKYGMEKYFIPEGDGPKLEALRNDKILSIVAAVSDSGEVGIKSLLVRGEPVYEEPMF